MDLNASWHTQIAQTAYIEMETKTKTNTNKRKLKSNFRLWDVNSSKWNLMQRMRWKCNSFKFVAKIEYENVHSLWQYWISDFVHIYIHTHAQRTQSLSMHACECVPFMCSCNFSVNRSIFQSYLIHLLHEISLWRFLLLFLLLLLLIFHSCV